MVDRDLVLIIFYLVTPRNGGYEGRLNAGHVALLDGGDELLYSGDLVMLEVAQQRGFEAQWTVGTGTCWALVTHPET